MEIFTRSFKIYFFFLNVNDHFTFLGMKWEKLGWENVKIEESWQS